jgi:hypothetical protein
VNDLDKAMRQDGHGQHRIVQPDWGVLSICQNQNKRIVQQMMLHTCNADYAADEGDLFGESDHSISDS